MNEWALYHIFPLSVESVVNTERAPGCPEGIDDADKKVRRIVFVKTRF